MDIKKIIIENSIDEAERIIQGKIQLFFERIMFVNVLTAFVIFLIWMC